MVNDVIALQTGKRQQRSRSLDLLYMGLFLFDIFVHEFLLGRGHGEHLGHAMLNHMYHREGGRGRDLDSHNR